MFSKKPADRRSQPVRSSSLRSLTSYEDAVQGSDEPRMTKVSVTVDRGLLALVDHYVQAHQGVNRSEIFDEALELGPAKYSRNPTMLVTQMEMPPRSSAGRRKIGQLYKMRQLSTSGE